MRAHGLRYWLVSGLTGLAILGAVAACGGAAATLPPAAVATVEPSSAPGATATPTNGPGGGIIGRPTGTLILGGGPPTGTTILGGRPTGTLILGGGPPTGTTILGGGRPTGTLTLGDGPPTPSALSVGAVAANSDGSCPDTHPIKAVLLGKIYHLKEDQSYARVRAGECFANEAEAQAAGYRRVPR